jgi:lysophospholipase L1-like esterase
MKTTPSKKKEFFINTVLVSASVLLSIFAIELFVTFVLDIRAPADPKFFYKIDPITGWAKKPNSEGMVRLYSDGTKSYVRNNGHGFTDREREITKSKPRIALVGDSTTEFWEAEEKDRGQFLMEQKLGARWEVLNFGVRGFSTDQAYLFLLHKGMKFSPDIVIYTFCINDIYGNTEKIKPYFKFESEKKLDLVLNDFPYPFKTLSLDDEKVSTSRFTRINENLTKYSFIYRKASRLLRSHPMGKYFVPLPLEDQTELRPYKKNYNSEDKDRIKLLFALIREMKMFLEAKGVRFLLVEGVYGNVLDPDRKAWSVENYGDVFDFDKVTRTLKEFSKKEGIPFLSIQDEVKRGGIPITEIMHPEDYVHLNTSGILLYSGWVLEKLKSLGWV